MCRSNINCSILQNQVWLLDTKQQEPGLNSQNKTFQTFYSQDLKKEIHLQQHSYYNHVTCYYR